MFIIIQNKPPPKAECNCHRNVAQKLQKGFTKDVQK